MASSLLAQSFLHSHVVACIRKPYSLGFCFHPKPNLAANTTKAFEFKFPRHHVRASSEGLPQEVLDDGKFVPINTDDPQFGPPAMMLMGVTHSDVLEIQELLKNMQGDFLKVLVCTKEMIKGTLWDAMNSSQPQLELIKAAEGVPRICFLSGLTGEEIMMFVEAFPEAKLEPTVFAALVPNNAQKTVEELIDEIMGDHQLLNKNDDS